MEHVNQRLRVFEVRYEIMLRSFQPNCRLATGDHTFCGMMISKHSTMPNMLRSIPLASL